MQTCKLLNLFPIHDIVGINRDKSGVSMLQSYKYAPFPTKVFASLCMALSPLVPFIANGEQLIPASTNRGPSIQSQVNPSIRGYLEVLTPIDIQLRAFREKDIRKAYEEPSSEAFKKNTPFETFAHYVEMYPALVNHEQISLEDQGEQGDKAVVNLVLDADKSNVTLQYLLIKEQGVWKIWSMEITTGYLRPVNELIHDPSTLNKPVEEFFNLLREGNLPKAYFGYTSKEFQTETSLEAFRKFFNDYEGFLKYESLSLEHPVIDNGTGKLEVVLHGYNLTTTLDVTLGIVGSQWKIWAINVLKQKPKEQLKPQEQTQSKEPIQSKEQTQPQEQPSRPADTFSTGTSSHSSAQSDFMNAPVSSGPLVFSKIELGNRVDEKGAIIDPQSTLSAPHSDLYIELYVLNGHQGDKIDVRLKHYDTQSELPTISTTLQQNGNSVISFSFSPPAVGWPKGSYQLEAESATGAKKVFTFIMN